MTPDQAQTSQDEEKHPLQHTEMLGIFNKSPSSYWSAMMAALGTRYGLLSLLSIYKGPPTLETIPANGVLPEKGIFKAIGHHGYSTLTGVLMQGITTLFMARTVQDMHSIFDKSLSWEFNKDPKDISLADFWNSENTVIKQTVNNFMFRNVLRSAMNLFFFLPAALSVISRAPIIRNLVPKTSKFHPDHWHEETGARLGLGANAGYLLTDVVGFGGFMEKREPSPMERLQSLADIKINHANSYADKIDNTDLLDIYESHAKSGRVPSFLHQRGTEQWERSMELFSRMADLMNQTYKNTIPKEKADFALSKFVYLMGHNLINPADTDRSRAYIEIANSYGIPEVQKAAQSIKNGKSAEQILAQYPLNTPQIQPETTPEKRFAAGLSPRQPLVTTVPASLAQQQLTRREAEPQLGPAAA